ncbi:MAG TPA: ABC transporter permease [Candidatus Dormibacteraeota bacterium]|jgi:phospholipid/cholesterol/gamma-HCH transport system permease protein|nr:ABC transporter permease [Candidatus Dormibacteraeota bacterium]
MAIAGPGQRLGERWERLMRPFDTMGEIILFAARALAGVPESWRYAGEIWWYAAFLALGSTPVALAITYFSGSECSVEAYYSLHQLGGAESLAGVFNALCDTREITPLFFGFAIGAKVGCGIVAELGTMRINEEIDALEVTGVPPLGYLVSTRLAASLLVLPLMYVLALGTSYLASWIVQHFQIGLVSDGVYFSYFWRFSNLEDLGFSILKAVVFAATIICVAVHQGYHVRGGPVGIGRAVARTMSISLVMTVLLNAVMTEIFWGHNPNLPIPT